MYNFRITPLVLYLAIRFFFTFWESLDDDGFTLSPDLYLILCLIFGLLKRIRSTVSHMTCLQKTNCLFIYRCCMKTICYLITILNGFVCAAYVLIFFFYFISLSHSHFFLFFFVFYFFFSFLLI